MKNKLKDFFNYSSSERKGSIVLVVLLLIVFSGYWFVDLFINSSEKEFNNLSEEIGLLTKYLDNQNQVSKEIVFFEFNPIFFSFNKAALILLFFVL